MKYYNKERNQYYVEGTEVTGIFGNVLFTGVPTAEQLEAWGFEPYEEPEPTPPSEEEMERKEKQNRLDAIKQQLQDMDYLTSKFVDGEDMTPYGDWQAKRKALRAEYNRLDAETNTVGE